MSKLYGNFVHISSLTGKWAAPKFKKIYTVTMKVNKMSLLNMVMLNNSTHILHGDISLDDIHTITV